MDQFRGQQLLLSIFDEVSDFVEEVAPVPDFPKAALYRGEMCRVLYYEGDGMFRLLDKGDRQMSVHRKRFTFPRPKRGKGDG